MVQVIESAAPPVTCPTCGTAVAATLLTCPQCRWLVHTTRLTALAADAEAAAARGETATAVALWQEALSLLPHGSRQHDAVAAKIIALGRSEAASAQTAGDTRGRANKWTIAGTAGAAALFLATKGKFLLFGLTKSTTLFTMFAAFGLYWTQWGMLFALGLVLSIYVHEMGHVAALHRLGIPASAPMFIPGIGAIVRMHLSPPTPRDDAYVGLAGPIWGTGAALVAYAAYAATGNQLWAAVGHAGAWINLFNLLPVWQLDGSRGFAALTSAQRWTVAALVAVAWAVSSEGLLVLILIVALARAIFDRSAPAEGDRATLARFCALVMVLAALTMWRA